MLNVIATTKNVTRNGSEFTITTYAVGGYTLVRTESPDRERAHWNVSAPHDLPPIIDMSAFRAKVPEFCVSWSSLGAQPSTDARAYGALIMTAADVADVFNHIVAGN